MVVISCQTLIANLLPPKSSPVSYPPYYPPEIQKISGWMQPNELIMSDIPWAVAWYGDHQCVWNTVNSQYEFFQFNDYVKQVRALYLTLDTLDGRLFTECLQGGVDSWGEFLFEDRRRQSDSAAISVAHSALRFAFWPFSNRPTTLGNPIKSSRRAPQTIHDT
jgi:hypothetical protein